MNSQNKLCHFRFSDERKRRGFISKDPLAFRYVGNAWGNVEVGEPLDQAVCREFLEETGVVIRPTGITGVYYNATKHVLSVVFKAEYVSGEIKIQPEEIKEAKYIKLNASNIDQYITRPQQKSRTLDAMNSKCFIPYETWEVDPTYNLLSRLYNE